MKGLKKYLYGTIGVCVLLLSGCGLLNGGKEPSSTPYPTGITQEKSDKMNQQERFSQVIMTVGDLDINYGEVVLYMQSTKEEVETLYGREVWNYVLDEEGTTYAQMLKTELLKQITYTKIVCAQADSLGIALTEDDKMDVDEYTDNYLSKFTSDELAYYGITREMVEGIYSDNLLAIKIYESLTLNVDTDISNEEARHPVLWYLFIAKYKIAEDGSHTALGEEELLKVRERAERLAEKARTAEDFYAFAKENTDDTDEIEIIVGHGEMFEELEKIAFNLLEGQTSGLIEMQDGYFILHCHSYIDEDATEQAKVDIILERQDKAFSNSYSIWEAETPVWVDQVLWNEIDLTGEKCE